MTSRLSSPAARRLCAAWALALAASTGAQAAASPADAASPSADPASWGTIRPVVGALVTGTISDEPSAVSNPDGSGASGNLGGRVQAFAGAEFPVAANGLKLRLTGGVQVGNMTSTSGASEHFTRFPLEATLLYPLNDKLRVGAGARYAARIRFSGPGGNTSDGLNATPALIVATDYRLFEHLLLDARYVYERYEMSGSPDFEGSHFGFGVTAQY